jgi:hypothetical protein
LGLRDMNDDLERELDVVFLELFDSFV